MGIQDSTEAACGQDGFHMPEKTPIEERLCEAAARVFESGVRKQGDQIIEGRNDARADFAAAAFTVPQLSQVQTYAMGKGDTELSMQISMVLARKRYMDDGKAEHLEYIYETGQKMVASGTFKGRAPV